MTGMGHYHSTDWLLTGCVLASALGLLAISGSLAFGRTHAETAAMIPKGVILPTLAVFSVISLLDS